MFESITFFNHFNNGDIHLSRGLIKHIIEKVSSQYSYVKFFYAHKRHDKLLQDLPLIINRNLSHSEKLGCFISGNDLFINTWYGADNFKYMNKHGISFDCLFDLFNDVCEQHLNFSLSEIDPKTLFPKIDYNQFYIKSINDFNLNRLEPQIIIANGPALSGQASNFNLTEVIEILAERYHGICFILTNREGNYKLRDNIKYSDNIIGNIGFDLNENAFLALNSKMIIGRSSGVFSFCINQDILFNRNLKLLSFSNLSYENFWLAEKFKNRISYTSEIKNFDIDSKEKALSIIDSEIKEIFKL